MQPAEETPAPETEVPEKVAKEVAEEPVVSAKDLGSIKDAIKSVEETQKAMHEEDLQKLEVSSTLLINGCSTVYTCVRSIDLI